MRASERSSGTAYTTSPSLAANSEAWGFVADHSGVRSDAGVPSARIGWDWLVLARVARFFTQKSHAALGRSHNSLISYEYWLQSGIFDSYRPLHPQASSGNVGTRHLGQPVDPVGKRWECESIWRLPRSLRYPYVAPVFTRIFTRSNSQEYFV